MERFKDEQTSYPLLTDQSATTSVQSKASQTMVQELTIAAPMWLPQAEAAQIEAPATGRTPAQTSMATANDTRKENGEEGESTASQASQQAMEELRAQPALTHDTQEVTQPPASPEDGYSSFTTVDGSQIPGLHPTASKLRLESDPASPVTASYPDTPNKATPLGTPNKATPPHTPSSSRCSRASHRFADTVKALRNIGCLTDKHASLRAKVEAMERVKADKTEVSVLESSTGRCECDMRCQGWRGLALPWTCMAAG